MERDSSETKEPPSKTVSAKYHWVFISDLSSHLTERATHAHPLHPAALASVPYGIVLVRVRFVLSIYGIFIVKG